jgi:asparagine synthase (glutamine-hydrolysing)
MCGISGIVNYPNPDDATLVVKRMLTRIKHRGPDESGIYAGKKATIGNVRLSIIDISSGQQPLSDPTGRYWIVFNGEIFNYIELREELEKKGCKFSTHSDTEVIVQMYAQFGKKAVEKLNGQFAFAIWDKEKDELFLARDRVGIRPLFYHNKDGVFTFGSEIKSIFENKYIKPEFSSESLSQVFTFWTTITPYTAFKDIFELSPGHYMTVNDKGIEIEKYWSIKYSTKQNYGVTDINEAAEQLDAIFKDSVRIRLRADVEVAAYLSGGIDSSVTTAYIKEIEPSVLHTFSIGFEEGEFDETKFQLEASKYLDTDHRAITCNSMDIANKFPDVVWHSEIPMIRTAPTPMYHLSKLVRDNDIKVVITGEGADEMLAGYNIFKEAEVRRFWAKYPDSKYRPLLLKKLYPYLPQMKNANATMLKMFFGFKLNETDKPYYSHLLRWNNASHIKKHFSSGIKSDVNGYDPFDALHQVMDKEVNNWDSLARSQYFETTVFMSGYLLSTQGDRMGMANSIEGRYPFLDHRLIEFCASLPPSFKLNGLDEKFLLKRLIKGKIPDSIVKSLKASIPCTYCKHIPFR